MDLQADPMFPVLKLRSAESAMFWSKAAWSRRRLRRFFLSRSRYVTVEPLSLADLQRSIAQIAEPQTQEGLSVILEELKALLGAQQNAS